MECFCGRALNNYRNKFHAADPTPGAYSWRRRAEIVPAALLACVEPEHSTQCGVPEVVTVPCCPCPPRAVTKGAVTVSCLGCEREIAVSWQDGSVLIPEEMGGKEGGSSKGHSQI